MNKKFWMVVSEHGLQRYATNVMFTTKQAAEYCAETNTIKHGDSFFVLEAISEIKREVKMIRLQTTGS